MIATNNNNLAANGTITLDTTNNLWDRQPNEPIKWFHRFEQYRLAGPERSVVGTFNQEQAKKSKKGQEYQYRTQAPGSWNLNFARWRWKERAAAFDESQVAEERAILQEARKAALKKHCEVGALAVAVSEQKLRSRRFVKRIAPREIVGLLRAGVDITRDALNLNKPDVQPPTIHLNLFEQIAARTAEMREQIVRELAERLRQQPPKVVQALPPPQQDIFDVIAAHDATNVGASKQPSERSAVEEK
jgi:hypothetical protein